MADIVNLKKCTPNALHSGGFWLNWMFKDGRKVPIDGTGRMVGHADPRAHSTLDNVIEQHKLNPALGAGISLGKDGLQIGGQWVWCLDFDGFLCRQADGGFDFDDGLVEFLTDLATWVEVSPSETGAKAFFLSEKLPTSKMIAKFPPSKFRNQFPDVRKYEHREVELFTKGFFLAITGERLGDWKEMRVLSATEADALVRRLNEWAIRSGGEGFGKHAQQPDGSTKTDSAQGRKEYAKPLLEDMATVLLYVDAEDEQIWSDTLNGIARTYGEDGRGIAHEYSRRSEKYDENECDSRYNRALRELENHPKGLTAWSTIQRAKGHPDWPMGFEVNYVSNNDADPTSLFGCCASVSAQLELPLGTDTANNKFVFKTASEVRNTPPMKWRIKELLPERGIGLLFGASGSGKSFLGFDMGACITLGRSFYGRKVVQCPVVYVALEGGAGVSKRVQAWERLHSQQMPDTFRIVTEPLSLLNSDALSFAGGLNAAALSGGVIIIDTLNQSAPGSDENSPSDMGTIISNAMVIQRLTDSLVLLVHHTGKDKRKGPRGHSSLGAALDVAIEVERNTVGREWSIHKLKDGEDGLSFPFKLECVSLGVDDDGDPITSCVAVSDLFRTNKPKPPTGKNQNTVLAAIKLCASNGLPLPYDEALKAASDSLANVEPKHRKGRATDAINRLVEGGHLSLDSGTFKLHL